MLNGKLQEIMVEDINYLIDLLGGNNNALSVLYFFIGIFFSFYLYFKTFFRLVIATERVCKKADEMIDWRNEINEYTTRVLVYNNGRKTLTKSEIKQLVINSTSDILSFRLLEESKNVKIYLKKRKINIDLEYLDSSKYFVLEIEHKGFIKVEGRISETGEILRIEPTYWKLINVFFICYLMYSLFNIGTNLDSKNLNDSTVIINFLLIIGTGITLRFIHSLLFIPDSLVAKYLGQKDKKRTEFRNKF